MPEQVIKNNGQNHIHQEYIQKKKKKTQTTATQMYFTTFFVRKKMRKKEVTGEKNKNFNSQLSFKAYQ